MFISVLLQYVQNDSPSSKSLAGLVVQLLQFQEDAFGRRVNNPALTKLPVSTKLSHYNHTTSYTLCCIFSNALMLVVITTSIVYIEYRQLVDLYSSSSIFRPSVSWILRQEVLSVTSWDRSTSSRASRAGELNFTDRKGFAHNL